MAKTTRNETHSYTYTSSNIQHIVNKIELKKKAKQMAIGIDTSLKLKITTNN